MGGRPVRRLLAPVQAKKDSGLHWGEVWGERSEWSLEESKPGMY